MWKGDTAISSAPTMAPCQPSKGLVIMYNVPTPAIPKSSGKSLATVSDSPNSAKAAQVSAECSSGLWAEGGLARIQ